jgi:dienelactone hydrolase
MLFQELKQGIITDRGLWWEVKEGEIYSGIAAEIKWVQYTKGGKNFKNVVIIGFCVSGKITVKFTLETKANYNIPSKAVSIFFRINYSGSGQKNLLQMLEKCFVHDMR